MKVTKFIPLVFTGTNARATAYISIPFKVKMIHIKSAALDAGTNGTTKYIAVMSDLVQNNPIAILNQDTSYSSATVQDIEHELWNPMDINGFYNFWFVDMAGANAAVTNNGDSVGLIIEFNGVDSF